MNTFFIGLTAFGLLALLILIVAVLGAMRRPIIVSPEPPPTPKDEEDNDPYIISAEHHVVLPGESGVGILVPVTVPARQEAAPCPNENSGSPHLSARYAPDGSVICDDCGYSGPLHPVDEPVSGRTYTDWQPPFDDNGMPAA